jgi:hypothetical protein
MLHRGDQRRGTCGVPEVGKPCDLRRRLGEPDGIMVIRIRRRDRAGGVIREYRLVA